MARKSFIALAALLFASLVTVSACAGIMYSNETQRYRVTVTITTPEGDKTGSVVREAGHHYEKSILPEQGGNFYAVVKGQAVVVDLGQRGKLFALIDSEREALSAIEMRNRQKGVPFVLTPDRYPIIAYFSDLNDPKTVKSLFYATSCKKKKWSIGEPPDCVYHDAIAETFGEGVKIKEISMELTDDKLDGNITSSLPWLEAVKMFYLSGRFSSGPDLYERLAGNQFLVGEK